MLVIDLIIALQKLPQNMQVMMDVTRDGSKIFAAKPVEDVDEIETSMGDKFVMIMGKPDDYLEDEN